MLRKLLLTLLIAFTLAAAAVSPASAKSYDAERYDVHVAIQPDGALLVTESITFRFAGGPFTYVFREMEYANLDEIDSLQASIDGQALPEGTGPGQVEIEPGRPLKVTWHFAPTSDAARTFTLTYRVLGAVRQDASSDTLIWRAVPEEHEYEIESATVVVDLPAGAALLGAPEAAGARASIEAQGSRVTATAFAIDDDTPLDVTLRFPPRTLAASAPRWQQEDQARSRAFGEALPYAGAAGGLALALILGWTAVQSRRLRREDTGAASAFFTVAAPPQNIPPALAAKLTGSSTGFLGTLFDLAQRGALTVEEGPKRWSGRQFELVRQASPGSLRPHERAFLDALFKKGERVPLSTIGTLMTKREFTRAVEDETVSLGWIDPERRDRRGRFLGWSVAAFVLGLLIVIIGLAAVGAIFAGLAGGILMGVGAALVVGGFIAMIAAAVVSPLTEAGAQQAAAWKSFASYLRDVTRGKEPMYSPDRFEPFLPYAAGLGLADAWAKFFQKMENVPMPGWFRPAAGAADMSGSYAAMYAAISSAHSSGSASAGGAAGASGGGASGAG